MIPLAQVCVYHGQFPGSQHKLFDTKSYTQAFDTREDCSTNGDAFHTWHHGLQYGHKRSNVWACSGGVCKRVVGMCNGACDCVRGVVNVRRSAERCRCTLV